MTAGMFVLVAVACLVTVGILSWRERKERNRIKRIVEDKLMAAKKPYEGDLRGTDNCHRYGLAMKVIKGAIVRVCRCKDGGIGIQLSIPPEAIREEEPDDAA